MHLSTLIIALLYAETCRPATILGNFLREIHLPWVGFPSPSEAAMVRKGLDLHKKISALRGLFPRPRESWNTRDPMVCLKMGYPMVPVNPID